jgi:hypothetical protein
MAALADTALPPPGPGRPAVSRKVPRWISEQYENGARGFKEEKRAQLRVVVKAFEDFRLGCAYLPCGSSDAFVALRHIQRAISIAEWGR